MPAKQKSKSLLRRKASFSHGLKISAAKPRRGPAKEAVVQKKRKSAEISTHEVKSESPYSGFAKPTAADVTRLHKVLAQHYGERRPPKRQRKTEILDTVVGTILSQNTTNVNSHRAFQQLKAAFPTWDAARNGKPSAVAASIKCGGLAPKKTKWIQHILRTLHAERGKTSMEYLRKESKERVHQELERFTGVGKKTSAIINLFEVGHPDMAVDTHVFRYALQLGWVPTEKERDMHNKRAKVSGDKPWPVVTRDSVYAHLDSRFPDELKYSMHLILTDTEGGLPVVCGATKSLTFDGRKIMVDGKAPEAL